MLQPNTRLYYRFEGSFSKNNNRLNEMVKQAHVGYRLDIIQCGQMFAPLKLFSYLVIRGN